VYSDGTWHAHPSRVPRVLLTRLPSSLRTLE
jgi:hypothetical protein